MCGCSNSEVDVPKVRPNNEARQRTSRLSEHRLPEHRLGYGRHWLGTTRSMFWLLRQA